MNATASSNIPVRNSMSRNHSHSVSLGAANPAHRVTRRKSMNSSTINNVAAIAAAMNGGSEQLSGSFHSNRRSLPVKSTGTGRPAEPMTIDRSDGFTGNGANAMDSRKKPDLLHGQEITLGDSAIAEGFLPTRREGAHSKARNRRASEGAPLSKSEAKRASGELRCEKCGKGYKHSSCLTKHLSVSSKCSFWLPRYTRVFLSLPLSSPDSP